MKESIPGAWQDGTANALAISAALSAKRGKTLPWCVVRGAIDAAIRARWVELTEGSAPWPGDLAGAQHVVLRVPEGGGSSTHEGEDDELKGLLVAEASLLANGIQDLAEEIPALLKAAVGHDLKFRLRVEFGGETRPDAGAVEQVNALLAEVSEELKLS